MRITLDDGVDIAYDDVGSGSHTVLLTHGLGCDRTLMAPQVEHFAKHYRVVNVDLRGHGESDKPDQAYHPDVLAHDLAALCTGLGLERPIHIGHSLGGVVGLRLEHLHPGSTSAIVALDSAIAVPEQVAAATPALVERLGALGEGEYRAAVTEVLQGFFHPFDDPQRKATIIATMASCPKQVFLSGWAETVVRCDTATPLQGLTIPMLFVAAQTSNGGLDTIRAGRGVAVGQTIGTGHFVEVECPDQVHAMIDRFLLVNGLA
jgi:pimeloyl-ACP methyl ester carboxylesterase